MRKSIIKISFYCFAFFFINCASYTVNICTIPPSEVEIYVNEQYQGSTSKDGKASIHIDPIEFEDEHLIELKKNNFYGLLKINHEGMPLEQKNVHYVSASVNNSNRG